jgi:beta-N-acetylhexosaminidase
MVGFRGQQLTAGDPVLTAIADLGLGGVILFERNIASPNQLTQLTARLQGAAGDRLLLIAIDQEGGSVARLGPQNGFAAMPSEAEMGRQNDPQALQRVGRSQAVTMADVGVTLNLAPVVDLNVNPSNPSIGALGRSFSADPQVVVSLAEALIKGEHAASPGVLTTLKHFPGLGSATGNTDLEFVDITHTWTRTELEPFRQLIADGVADMVMVANALNGQLDASYPSSLSQPTIDMLRTELGWQGVVISDDLQAGALKVRFSDANIIRLALQAGNDLLLLANTGKDVPDLASRTVDTIEQLVQAGTISEARINESFGRIRSLIASRFGEGAAGPAN